MKKYSHIFCLSLILLLGSFRSYGQLQVTTGHNATQLLNYLLGAGVTVTNITSSGLQGASNPTLWQAGKFWKGNAAGITADSGILLTSGNALLAIGPNNLPGAGANTGNPGDPDLNIASGTTTLDACILEFDFVPQFDTIKFRYVFGSEEYHQYVNSINDVFAFFITGPNPAGGTYNKTNIALIPIVNQVVSINTINFGSSGDCPPGNGCVNCQYLINNCQSGKSIQYDAYTVVMTAKAAVVPCSTYHLKVAIADAVDRILDSGVFLEAGSFSSPGVAVTPVYSTPGNAQVAVESCSYTDLQITLPFPFAAGYWFVFDSIKGTATNGVDCNLINDSIFFPAGITVQTIQIYPIMDGITEPDETLIFYYSSSTCAGIIISSIQVVFANFDPVVISPTDITICSNSNALLDAGPGWKTYLWNTGATTQTISPVSSGTYTVDVTDAFGCPSSDTRELTIAPLPPSQLIKHN
ncbi:MAG: choice-of-anchor L domain-containing protein [Bacteroidales bacterium]|nr:choice-of-anchor L domain-containing protein [Bacteroidales bacterium]